MNNSDKWVCVTKSWDSFTYGKIYEGDLEGELLNVPNDFGEYHLPALYRWEPIDNYKESKRFYVDSRQMEFIPKRKVYYFITLEEWREQQIVKIL
jgi:hypothetical protein